MPIAVPSAVTVKPGVHITFNLSKMWYVLARDFAHVAEDVLKKETLDFARMVGQEMLYQIREHALPYSLTGRLADTRTGMTWRLWISTLTRTVTVKLHTPEEVPPDTGRSTLIYASKMEWGSGAHRAPWGKYARLRFEYWAQRRGIDRRSVRFIMASIYKHGTAPHPYFVPAARATARAAAERVEIYGFNWRDGVEAELKARF